MSRNGIDQSKVLDLLQVASDLDEAYLPFFEDAKQEFYTRKPQDNEE